MRILVTGAAGMLGRALMRAGDGRHDLAGIDLPDGDLTDAEVPRGLLDRFEPARVIHCAAFTDVDGAESRRDEAMAINTVATGNLADACADAGCALTCLSTDYVFAGDDPAGYDEDAARDPVNFYGATKAAAEEAVEASAASWQLVRTSWLFGAGGKNFVDTIRRLLGRDGRLRVVDDQRGCPTFADDLAAALLCLAEVDATGYFHVTNTGDCSWCDFARRIALEVGEDPARVEACASNEYVTAARRPVCSILRSRRLAEAGCEPPPHWHNALTRYLAGNDGKG